jgi:hypothetical protein
MVRIVAPDGYWKGNLSDFVVEAIERQLQTLGALPQRGTLDLEPEARLEDQLRRSAELGYDGLGLVFVALDGIATGGVIDVCDSQTLRWWLHQSATSRVSVDLPRSAAELMIHPDPLPIAEWLATVSGKQTIVPPGFPSQRNESRPPDEVADEPELGEVTDSPPASATRALDPDPHERGGILGDARITSEVAEAEPAWPLGQHSHADDDELDVVGKHAWIPPDTGKRSVDDRVEFDAGSPSADNTESYEPPEPAHVQHWRRTLESAGGPQSWEDLERLFVASYLPLIHAIHHGQAGREALATTTAWADDFRDCYAAAFRRVQSGRHRPTLVADLPQLAFRLARELTVRQTRLVLVDGLRFDVGQRVHDKLRLQLAGFAQCVQRGVLWSALPATTGVQLELLAKGGASLQNVSGNFDEQRWVAKGAAARQLRPLRVGGLQLAKLDILEAEFRGVTWDDEHLERGAAEVAVSVGRSMRKLASGTLVVVFGDHGSPTDGAESASGRPEEVLVPYDAWQVGSPD